MLKHWHVAIVVLGLAGVGSAQEVGKQQASGGAEKKQEGGKGGELTDAKEILKKADEATKKVKMVRYQAEAMGTGASESQMPKAKGTAVMGGEKSEQGLGKFRFEVKGVPPGSKDEVEVTAGSDADKFWVMDAKNKTVHEDIDPAVMGRMGGIATSIAMREFVHPNPFGDEINGDKQELRGTRDIRGEKCYEIFVQYKGGQGAATWWFSVKDFLPRRVDREFPRGGGAKVTLTVELGELTVDPTFTTDPFKVVVPDGYKKTDEPAP